MKHRADQHLTYRLDRLTKEAGKAVVDAYDRACGLTVPEIRVLRIVSNQPGITFSRLVDETYYERTFTSRLVTRLCAKGLVARKAEKADARQYALRLTAKGNGTLVIANRVGDRLEKILMSPLSAEEQARLLDYLDRLTDWVRKEAFT